MNELQSYLVQHYLTAVEAARALDITNTKFDALLSAGAIAAPSYVICDHRLRSVVFGEFEAKGLEDASYFHRDMLPWMQHAVQLSDGCDSLEVSQIMAREFKRDFAIALQDLHQREWPLLDAFDADGIAIELGLAQRCEQNWNHFKSGIFGLCVARPVSAAAIAEKEVLQEKLAALSQQILNLDMSDVEARATVWQLIARYEKVAMPFTHLEYPRSSRFRLVEQLRQTLLANTEAREDHAE